MLKLKEIIKRLGEDNYSSLVKELEGNKAEKFQKLLMFYREDQFSDDEILSELQLNVNAFYTLKSRLFDKIQQKLTNELGGDSAGLIQQVTHIPVLLYDTPREVAIATLKKLEKDLLDNDLYNELIPVYAALKKLHYNSPKFFNYSQQYNRHIAYTLALGKAADLLSDFNKCIEEYFISPSPILKDQLGLLKQEVDNHYRLNESHQLYVFKSIVDISCSLFIGENSFSKDDDPVDEILKKVEGVFEEYTQEPSYQYLKQIFDFLSFTYYFKLNLEKNARKYFERVYALFPGFLELDHTVFSFHFLSDLLKWRIANDENTELDTDAEIVSGLKNGSQLSVAQKIITSKFLAGKYYYQKQFDKAAQVLQQLINEVSFKHLPHAETEVKLFLALNQVLSDKAEPALITMRSVTRKIRETGNGSNYDGIKIWSKIINLMVKSPYDGKKKSSDLMEQFNNQNSKGPYFLNMFIPENSLVNKLRE